MGVVNLSRQRRKQKSDRYSRRKSQEKPGCNRKISDVHQLCDNGGQAGSVKPHIDIMRHVGFMIFGVKPDTQHNRPDIEQIFSKQGKSKHQAGGRDSMSVHLHIQKIDKGNTEKRENACVQKSGSHSAYHEIVGNQEIRLLDQRSYPGPDLRKGLENKAADNKVNRNQRQKKEFISSGQNPFVKHLCTTFLYSISSHYI